MKFNYFFIVLLAVMAACGAKKNDGDPKKEDEKEQEQLPEDIGVTGFNCRDPFIFYSDIADLYYVHVNGGAKINCYTSKDLLTWTLAGTSFTPPEGFWAPKEFWAPDMYQYKGKYYIFASPRPEAEGGKRGTTILVSMSPAGPYEPLINGPSTPEGHQCLDGSLYIDKQGAPWLIYCREWLEVIDGQVCALPLSDDLKEAVGDPVILFSASSAPWVTDITSSGVRGKVTDAPFVHTLDDGKLIMLWSSFSISGGRYSIGQAFSDGEITGPWTQAKYPLNYDYGGHAMLFRDRDGVLQMSYHSPNSAPSYMTIRRAYIENGQFKLNIKYE